MTAPPARFVLKDTIGDEIIVTYTVDDERRSFSRCHIEFCNGISIDMALDPDMLEKLTDHLTAVWQVLDRTEEPTDD